MDMEATRKKMRKLTEDMIGSEERRKDAERRRSNERFNVMIWLISHELTIANGEDIVDMEARWAKQQGREPLESIRGIAYFFDIHHEGKVIGRGHVCWHAGLEKPFRELDWHLNLADGTESYELGEEVWRRARLDRQLPRRFRKGYRSHPKHIVEALDQCYQLDECG